MKTHHEQGELENDVPRFATFINHDEELALDLMRSDGDVDRIRGILSKKADADFILNIMNAVGGMYDGVVVALSEYIIGLYPGAQGDFIERRLEIGHPMKSDVVPKKQEIEYISTKSGKRAKARKWTKLEEAYIRERKDLSNKQMIKEFNEFPNIPFYRTPGSILSKKKALKKSGAW